MVHTAESTPLTIEVTDKAAKMVHRFATKEGFEENFALRVGVKGGGCSGLLYVLEIKENAPSSDDRVIDENGIKIFIDKKSYVFLAGTILEYGDGLNGRGFEFNNPNAKSTCGCGTSFSV